MVFAPVDQVLRVTIQVVPGLLYALVFGSAFLREHGIMGFV